MTRPLQSKTRRQIAEIFHRLDYSKLGPVYCDEGGDEFWKAKRGPCLRIGMRLAEILRPKLAAEGRSLYVGGGVPEIPALVMETMELRRRVSVHNLRAAEVASVESYLWRDRIAISGYGRCVGARAL